jgi:hypothetical protein
LQGVDQAEPEVSAHLLAVLMKFNHILPKLPSIIARSVWLLPEQVRPNLYCLPRVLARIANSGVCISDLFAYIENQVSDAGTI